MSGLKPAGRWAVRVRVMSRFAFAAVLVVLAGCASEAVPRGADESVAIAPVEQVSETAAAPSATAAVIAPAPQTQGAPCTAGATRACKKTWVDANGITNCIESLQYCASDARAWLECGAPYDGALGTD